MDEFLVDDFLSDLFWIVFQSVKFSLNNEIHDKEYQNKYIYKTPISDIISVK